MAAGVARLNRSDEHWWAPPRRLKWPTLARTILRRGANRAALVGLACFAVAACSPPLEFADWTIPVPEGARIIEYAAVPMEERTERIELAEDLVLGADEGEPNQAFYGPRDVAIDKNGHIWVLEGGNHRIQEFDADGKFVRSVGREGQGPGELDQPSYLIAMGDRIICETSRTRLSIWNLDGEHERDVTLPNGKAPLSFLAPIGDDEFVAAYGSMPSPGGLEPGVHITPMAVSSFSLDGAELVRIVDLPSRMFFMTSNAPRPAGTPITWPATSWESSSSGQIYATTSEEYQVLAISPEGEIDWAMRVAWEAEAVTEDLIEQSIESARVRRPDTTRSDLIFPERLPVLSHVAVDGHGHVYVYPRFLRGETLEDRPVDVYSADGDHLFSGMIPDRRWRRAQGDFVYAAGTDRATGEYRVWRWKLVEPFE